MDPPRQSDVDDIALDALVDEFARDIENLLGAIRFAARIEIRPEVCYDNIRDDFLLISHTHVARLSMSVTD